MSTSAPSRSTIHVTCSACAKTFRLSPEKAGKRGRCSCGAPIAVPSNSSEQLATDQIAARPKGTFLSPEIVVMVGCVITALIAIPVASVQYTSTTQKRAASEKTPPARHLRDFAHAKRWFANKYTQLPTRPSQVPLLLSDRKNQVYGILGRIDRLQGKTVHWTLPIKQKGEEQILLQEEYIVLETDGLYRPMHYTLLVEAPPLIIGKDVPRKQLSQLGSQISVRGTIAEAEMADKAMGWQARVRLLNVAYNAR